MTITLNTEGRRTYLSGNTYEHRDAIKAAGGRWDAEQKSWWFGKRDAAEALLARLVATPAPTTSTSAAPYSGEVRGKAEYKERTYYVRWAGTTKRGEAVRLVTLDGKIDFWAPADAVVWVKHYGKRDDYRGTYPTLEGIRDFVARNKRESTATGIDCWKCRRESQNGNLRRHLHDGCEVCGAEG
jgi:hypothetical protein